MLILSSFVFGVEDSKPKIEKFCCNSKDLDELVEFTEISSVSDLNFFGYYDECEMTLHMALEILKNKKQLSSEFKIQALEVTRKAVSSLNVYRGVVSPFRKSTNDNLRKCASELTKLHNHASVVLDLYHKFYISPSSFISSNENMDSLMRYRMLLKQQYEYTWKLIVDLMKLELEKSYES